MFSWFKGAEKSLEDILGHFNTVHDDLTVFVDKAADNVNALQQQLDQHKGDLDQARSILTNIKNILNKQ